jgi:DNA-binding response OmpR family regulator
MTSDDRASGRPHPRFIIVEDNFSVAEGLRYLLEAFGCDVVGMAADVPRALELVGGTAFDLALLDIDLGGEHVGPVAEAVRSRGRLVIFLSGYGEDEVLPVDLRALPRLEKPVDPDQLLSAIRDALDFTPID